MSSVTEILSFEPFPGKDLKEGGNFELLAIDNSGSSIFFKTSNDLGMGVYSHSLRTGQTTRLDVDQLGNTVTYQGWGVDDFDVNSNGTKAVFPYAIGLIQLTIIHKVPQFM